MLRDAVFKLIGVAHDVGVVETQYAQEVIHSLHIAVGDLRLQRVPYLCAEQVSQRPGHCKGALQHRRPDGHLHLQIRAIDGLRQLHRRRSCFVGRLPGAGIHRLPRR